MCDQDHFEDDQKKFEALGQVTRRQFGVHRRGGHRDDAAGGGQCR